MPDIFLELLDEFEIKELYFVKGPGSFMAIKISYIFLRTLAQTLNIPLLACEGFDVNKNSPIHAYGKVFFMKKNGKIVTEIFTDIPNGEFKLPKNLEDIDFTNDIEPLYILPAV